MFLLNLLKEILDYSFVGASAKVFANVILDIIYSENEKSNNYTQKYELCLDQFCDESFCSFNDMVVQILQSLNMYNEDEIDVTKFIKTDMVVNMYKLQKEKNIFLSNPMLIK